MSDYAPRDSRTRDKIVLAAEDASPFRRHGRPEPGRWGPWHLDREERTLWTEAGGYRYDIDLDSCRSSAQVLDWICQIADKLWAGTAAENHAITAGLACALIDVLHPQANLCSCGISKRLSAVQLRYLVANAVEP